MSKLSEKGKDWKGKPLNDDTLDGQRLVMWRNKVYQTGNRYHHLVELWGNRQFIRTVSMRHIRLVEIDIHEITIEEINYMLEKKKEFLIKKGITI
jgi:hypothetical protein